MKNTAKAETRISAGVEHVWWALTDTDMMEKYMFGASIETTWKVGETITWKGEHEGKPYTETGKVLEVVPNERLVYTHGGHGDTGKTRTITITLSHAGASTLVTLTQDNNADEAETARSTENWETMLGQLRQLVEEEGLIA